MIEKQLIFNNELILSELEDMVLTVIKANHGISPVNLALLLKESSDSIEEAVDKLYHIGLATNWNSRLYPNYRSIEIFAKDQDDLIEEIVLAVYLTPKQIGEYITYIEDDRWYCLCYEVDEKSKLLFEKSNNVKFDFARFRYFLTYSMDNNDDIGTITKN